MLANPSARRLALLAGLCLLVAPARAQFSQFSWTFNGANGGSGTVTANEMFLVGPDSGPLLCNGTASFQAIAPYDLVVVADYEVDNHDKAGPGHDWLVTIVDGASKSVSGQCTGCQLSIEVPAGSSFGFGVFSNDCAFGSASAKLTNLVVQPAPQVLSTAGAAAGNQTGTAVAAFSDTDGDGVSELAVGAPGVASEKGRVTLFKGADFAAYRVLDGAFTGDRFGAALAGVGDQNGDGAGDLLIGVPRADIGAPNTGAARLCSGTTGGTLATLPGSASGDEFGRALADAGDLDGDGLHDLLIAAPRHDGVGADSGEVVVLAGGSHALLATWTGAAVGDQFGSAVAGVGDLDGDGVPDVAIGTPLANMLAPDSGRAQVFSGGTGALLHELLPLACNGDQGDKFGSAVAGVGDVDGDGTPDVAVGVPFENCSGNLSAGALRVYSGADGHLLYNHFGSNTGEQSGSSLAGLGDADGDGTPDVLVGSPMNEVGTGVNGLARILSGDDAANLLALAGAEFDGSFGFAVAAAGDTDGDGTPDALVGAPAPFGEQIGTAHLVRPEFLWTDLGFALAGSGTPALDGEGLLAPGTPIKFTLSGTAPGLPTTFLAGATLLAAPFKGGVLVPSPDFVRGGLVTGSQGLVFAHFFPPGLPAGLELYFQMWLADPAGPKGFSASNALRASIP